MTRRAGLADLSLRMPLAMIAGIADRLWSLRDIAAKVAMAPALRPQAVQDPEKAA